MSIYDAQSGTTHHTREREARWEAAAHAAGREVDRNALRAYMAVATEEQQALARQRDQYAAAIRQLILQVRQTAHVWVTTLPETIPTAEVARALSFCCSPVPLPDDLRDDLWQQIVGAYYVRFENDGHPEDAQAAADVARAIVEPELERLRAELAAVRNEAPRD